MGTILLAQAGLHQDIIIFTFILVAFSFLLYNLNVVTIFIYFLPLSQIIPTGLNLGGIIGIDEVVQIAVIIFFIIHRTVRRPFTQWQRLCVNILILIMFIEIYQIGKDILFGLIDKDIGYLINSIIKRATKYIPLILIINSLQIKKLQTYVFTGIVFSIVTIVLSSFFVDELINIRLLALDKILESEIGFYRVAGLYGAGGDANSAAAFLVVAIGFFLAMYEKRIQTGTSLVIISISVLGVLLTASRTSMISLGIVLLFFLLRNHKSKNIWAIITASMIFIIALSPVINRSVSRFKTESFYAAIDLEQTGRIGKLKIYTKWLANNPETLLFGNQKKIKFRRAPHNYFIYLVYHVGGLFLIYFLYCVTKLIHFSLKEKNGLFKLYAIFPFVFVLLTINSPGSGIFLWIFLPISYYMFEDKTQTDIPNA